MLAYIGLTKIKEKTMEGIFPGLIVALLGIFIAIFIALFTTILRSINELRIDVKSIQMNIESLRKTPITPSSYLFFSVMAREEKFWGKLFIQRSDKIAISWTIASNYVQERDTIIVDSGTTVDQIPHILREKHLIVKVHTNNLLAAISVVPRVEGFDCFLLSGKIDPIYGATYNIENIEGPLRLIKANQIILAATALSFEEGPMVNVLDISNRLFKRELVRKALQDDGNPSLLIAVDWTKFREDLKMSKKLNAVLEIEDWRSVKATKRFVFVTTNPPDSLQTPDAIRAREVISAFSTNMRKGGMKVEICKV